VHFTQLYKNEVIDLRGKMSSETLVIKETGLIKDNNFWGRENIVLVFFPMIHEGAIIFEIINMFLPQND
jgi:hypothetical protein